MNDQSTPNRLGRVATILAAVVAVAALGVALVALTRPRTTTVAHPAGPLRWLRSPGKSGC